MKIDLFEILTVNEIIRRYPASIAIFNRFSIDACCGGGVSVREAAIRDGVDPEVLIAALLELQMVTT
jgi:regulator of cell morphogenesis and NO signaling